MSSKNTIHILSRVAESEGISTLPHLKSLKVSGFNPLQQYLIVTDDFEAG